MRKMALMVLAVFCLAMASTPVWAQFGKNQVIWQPSDARWEFYQSEHCDFYYALDRSDPRIQKHLTDLVAHVENSYDFLSQHLRYRLKKRPIVIVTRTHSAFEALRFSGSPFIPEGVGAFATPRSGLLVPNADLMLVVKPDFLPALNQTILTHELVHIFQFDMLGYNAIRQVTGRSGPPHWLYEGSADYLANRFWPYTRDDIRRMTQRVSAANPEKDLPTLEKLEDGRANPYAIGPMYFEYLEAMYGSDAVDQLIRDSFAGRRASFIRLVSELSSGTVKNREELDRATRDFWRIRLAQNAMAHPKPYDNTTSVRGRQVLRDPYPMPCMSPVLAPTTASVACMTITSKNGVVVATMPTLPRDDPPYKQPEKKKFLFVLTRSDEDNPKAQVKVVTDYLPPKPYEYIVAQGLETWPFNGSDLDWWQGNGGQSAIAFFARKNRDHALFILDANNGKIAQTVELSLDQAFSPSFSPDGRTVYFSAAANIDRNIYSVDLTSKKVRQLTSGAVFASAPAVSPDGTTLAYVAFVGDFQKLFLLDVASGQSRQLTFGRWNDNSPSWSRDGASVAFTSDELEGIWNLYSYTFTTRTVRQWTDLYGGVFSPRFAPGETDRIVATVFWQYSQYRSVIYPNFQLYDFRLKVPLREYIAQADAPTADMQMTFHPETVVAKQLDGQQIKDHQSPPARWTFHGSDVTVGHNTYVGTFGYSRGRLEDLLGNRVHEFGFARQGDFRLLHYQFTNMSRRLGWATGMSSVQVPYRYLFYDIRAGAPANQMVLNTTWASETNASLYAEYPFSKWERLEFGLRLHKQHFILTSGLTDEFISQNPDAVSPQDIAFYRFFRASDGQVNLGISTAFVQDTVLFTQGAQGALHGRALRIGLEYGPALNGNTHTYATTSLDLRQYHRLSDRSVFALRLAGMASSRPNGDFLLLGGTSDTLRAYPYGSVVGNQVAYAGAELRFPLVDVVVLPLGIAIGPVRGMFFGDYALAKFSHISSPVQREWSYGVGMRLWSLNFAWARRKIDRAHWEFQFTFGMPF